MNLSGMIGFVVAIVATSTGHAAADDFTFAGIADYDNDGFQDIIARDPSGLLWLYPGEGTRAYSKQARVQIGNGWNGYTFAGIADYDNDGNQDIVVRDATGDLWLYPGEGTRAYTKQARVQIGNGWNGYTFAGVADYDNDGHQDIVVQDSSGLLFLYPGEGTRAYSRQARLEIGNGWNGYMFAGVADYDNDGHQDIVVRDSTGLLFLYPGEGTRAYSSQARVEIGNGWKGYSFAGIADYDNDSNQDIVVRDQNDVLWLYAGEGTRGYSSQARVQIGNGW